MRRLGLAILTLLTVLGCTTPSTTIPPSHPEAVAARIERALERGSPAEAVALLNAAERQSTLPGGRIDVFLERAVRGIEEEYEKALEGNDFATAIRAHKNMVTLGSAPENASLLSELYVKRYEQLRENRTAGAAIATLLQAPRLDMLPPDTLGNAALLARDLNNRYALGVLLEFLDAEWKSDNPEIVDFATSEESAVRMSEGVVTVWVNRGLRLEGGVGIPDRVIGSGFFIDPEGYLITNYHVIASEVDPEYEGYSRLYVRLPDNPNQRVPARVLGYSPIFDVALLKVELPAPYVFSFTNIRSLEPGSRILAIGSPGGLENSITSGIISATGRRFLQMGDTMQVDVAINPGNSGGPLLDPSGRLVGVVFAGIEQFEGVNFAVPSFWVHPFLSELYGEGQVRHPWIGAAVEPVQSGLEITYVHLGSPAANAGLQVGDRITKINGFAVESIAGSHSVLLDLQAGSIVEVEWTRDDETTTGLLSLGARPRRPLVQALSDDLNERLYAPLFGMLVDRSGSSFFRAQYTVTQVYPGSIADETGITVGDTFTEWGFDYDEELGVVFLRMFVAKRTDGFMRTSLQLPAYIERDNFL